MVAADDERAGAPRDVEHAERVGPARDQVADEDEAVAAGETNAIEEPFQLQPAAMNVADDDRRAPQWRMPAHAPCANKRLRSIRPVWG